MDLSVVIPVRNGARTLAGTLESLAGQAVDGSWEVVLADDHSTDRTRDVAESFSADLPGLRVVTVAGTGVAAARNSGVRAAAGDLLLFCDADDTVRPGYLQAMLDGSRAADLLSGRLNEIRPLDSPPMRSGNPIDRPHHGFLPFAQGACLGVTRRAFDEVGGFATDLEPVGAEDVDFSWRVQLAGYELGYVVDAVVDYAHRDRLRPLLRQRFVWSRADVELLKRHSVNGLRPRSTIKALRHWGWLVVHLPDLGSRGGRVAWLCTAAVLTGRVAGCVRSRFYAP